MEFSLEQLLFRQHMVEPSVQLSLNHVMNNHAHKMLVKQMVCVFPQKESDKRNGKFHAKDNRIKLSQPIQQIIGRGTDLVEIIPIQVQPSQLNALCFQIHRKPVLKVKLVFLPQLLLIIIHGTFNVREDTTIDLQWILQIHGAGMIIKEPAKPCCIQAQNKR
jgi:hypothetical protein